MIIYAICQIHHNVSGQFETSSEIDPATAEYRVRAISTILQPDLIHDVPPDLGAEMIRLGGAREPTERELQLYQLANGAVVVGGAQ